ncbi:MAG TPA: arginine decarboxylase [Halieaceae bacterium]|nr:arginine decarboxylase [Halieaceae bacterium]
MSWTLDDATARYGIDRWGSGYFAINDAGHVCVRPGGADGPAVDLHDVVERLRARDLTAPLVIRFSGIIAASMRRLAGAFEGAMAENGYRGSYRAVFPIKVNQHRQVVEEVYRQGEPLGFGLEAGSKPELLAVLAMTGDAGDRPIVCNGFKDDSYIEVATLAAKLGRNIIPVVENFEELQLILKHARKHGVRPAIGVRVKLGGQGIGRWATTMGPKSKFGLSATQVLELVDVLRREDMLDCLQLVHCHPGSQLSDIRAIKDAVGELAHMYAELHRLGAGLRYIDIGGGLGVDYEGTGQDLPRSLNYSLAEYASAVVYRIAAVCDQAGIEHPVILSESGRALSAYCSVLVVNALGSLRFEDREPLALPAEDELQPQPLADLVTAWRDLDGDRPVEVFHDAEQAYQQAMQLFTVGLLGLEQRALAERLFWAICTRLRDRYGDGEELPAAVADLPAALSDIYFCNFSVFQSLPDFWAIDQLFPIMPIHRLDEPPTRAATLADITCDSDVKVDRFALPGGPSPLLPVHPLREDEAYYLGAFLIGAYQETLGDLHNLFGDTHVVTIHPEADGGWSIDEIVRGDTASELLGYMQFSTESLRPRIWRDCERAVRDGRLTLAESQALRRFYEEELESYAYLDLP